MSMPGHALMDHLASGHVESGKQRGGAMSLVVVGQGPGTALLERQTGLGTVQRLDLALLVEREHDRPLRGRQVEPDHVAELLHEPGVPGELEGLDPVRLETVGSPDPGHLGGVQGV